MTDESLKINDYGIQLVGGTAKQPELYVKHLNTELSASDYLKTKDRILGINGISMSGYTWDEAMYMLQNSNEKLEINIMRTFIIKPNQISKKKSLELKNKIHLGNGDFKDSGNSDENSLKSSKNSQENLRLEVPEPRARRREREVVTQPRREVSNKSQYSVNSSFKSLQIAADRPKIQEQPLEKQTARPEIEVTPPVPRSRPAVEPVTVDQFEAEPNPPPPAVRSTGSSKSNLLPPPKAKIQLTNKKSFGDYKIVGNQEKCTKCNKTVYHAERCIGPVSNIYHKMCLSCTNGCGTNLSTGNWLDHASLPYCKSCYNKQFGLHGTVTGSMKNRG